MPTLSNHANLTTEQAHALVREIRPLAHIDDAVRWREGQVDGRAILEVLVQDETSHDIVMEWMDGKHLVFDTDCLGGVRNISVWDYRPSPEEILDMRRASGWEASVVRGHAGSTCPMMKLVLP